MSSETLDFHHGKHHQTYVTNLNNLVKDTDMQNSSLEEIVVKSSKDSSMAGIFNNAGQHWNHILFWQCMKPNGGGSMPSELERRITSDLGGIDQFKEASLNWSIPPRSDVILLSNSDGIEPPPLGFIHCQNKIWFQC